MFLPFLKNDLLLTGNIAVEIAAVLCSFPAHYLIHINIFLEHDKKP